ncbi:MAG: PIN domain-containing protein [Prevotella sp.]|nr:PIN domain-containing protein [Prevotella sp.]
MKNVFLDTNILIDFMARRENFYDNAAIIFSLGMNKRIKLYVAAMSFATASYVVRKDIEKQAIQTLVKSICKYCHIGVVDSDCVLYGAISDFTDFEDAMQYRCAQKIKADYIVTRNVKDFANSSIPVFTPSDFLSAITE